MKIMILNGNRQYSTMFLNNGWEIVSNPYEADAIQFTGGEDVSPMLYGEPPHATTGNNPNRDNQETNIFNTFFNKPKFGICRGSQLLCALSGGSLWQDVNNHGIGGTHAATVKDTEKTIQVTSTHHQMMRVSEDCEVDLLMYANLSTRKSDGYGQQNIYDVDIESLYWPETNSLCYQPHPEYVGFDHECQKTYFDFIEQKFGMRA